MNALNSRSYTAEVMRHRGQIMAFDLQSTIARGDKVCRIVISRNP